jgi:hypothetical protein
MPINVTCPGCLTRFTVSEKFAGRSGACPKCKSPIRVPSKEEAVEVHAPQQFGSGGRGKDGKLILKPIAREQRKFSVGLAIGVVAGVAAAFAVAALGRGLLREYWLFRALGLLVVSPPLVWAGYLFLRDDDNLEIFAGRMMLVRTAICAAAYAALWGVFGYVAGHTLTGEIWNWFLTAPPFVITGALVGLACYDLDFGNGCLHYGFYVLVTALLRAAAGMGWLWQIGQ